MRVLALLSVLLLLTMPVALAQQNNTTENQTSTEQASGSNDTDTAEDGSEDETNVTLPDRSGHVPWGGLAAGLIIFAASVVVSRVTYHGHD